MVPSMATVQIEIKELDELRDRIVFMTNELAKAEGNHRQVRALLTSFVAALNLRVKNARSKLEADICEDIARAMQFILNRSIELLPKNADEL